ncbi:MAG: tetratricopeptide repeat protein [Spirochaetota bacterium]
MRTGKYGIIIIMFLFSVSCSSFYKSVIDKRNQNYKEGIELYNKKNYEGARDRFKTVMDIEPGYRDTKKYWAMLDNIIRSKEKQAIQRANANYAKGLAFVKQRQYENALNYFLLVKADNPDHGTVDLKITECRQKLVPRLNETLKQGERLYGRRQYIQAYNAYLKAALFDPSSPDAAQLKSKIEDKLDEKCRKYRAKGKEHYAKKQYANAQQQFELALNNNPWDRESRDLLTHARRWIYLDNFYNTTVGEFNDADYFKARSSFLSIHNMEPGYRATEQYLEKINVILSKQLSTIYNKGVSLYDKGDYKAAITEFNKVLLIDPDHAMAEEYRQRAQAKLDIQKSLKGE